MWLSKLCFFSRTVIMGFEHATYSISEGNGSVEVCVQVKNGVLQSSLTLSFTTLDGEATCEQCCNLNVYSNLQSIWFLRFSVIFNKESVLWIYGSGQRALVQLSMKSHVVI